MHDQSLEQRLRAVLQAEGDALPLTITAAELERRLALRRRGGLSPMASLGLAAAVGAGLLGLAGIAGGWFEAQPVMTSPPPSAISAATTAPSQSNAPSSGPKGLPSLDEFVAPLEEGAIVRAQAVGPADGSGSGVAIKRAAWFAPIEKAGVYRVWAACLGSDLELWATRGNFNEPVERVPITCDGSITSRQMGFEVGDRLYVVSNKPASWRVALEAPGRSAPQATELRSEPEVPTGDGLVLDAASVTAVPIYQDPLFGGGAFVPGDVGVVAERDVYRVTFVCAGPRPIRYAFRSLADESTAPEDVTEYSSTQVECDGAPHTDELELPLIEGGRLFVTADDRDAWRILVTSTAPPIAIAPNGNGWTLSAASGPDWLTGETSAVSLPGPDDGGRARVTISCFGDGTVTGTIFVGPREGDPVDPFTLDCSIEHINGVVLVRTYAKAGPAIDVVYDLHGIPAWVAITVQVRAPASPPP